MKASEIVSTYLATVDKQACTGVAREHSYRPALSSLLHDLIPGSLAVNEPAQIACGAPDFAVFKGDILLGHVEAKDLGADLDQLLKTDQLKRYLAGLPNFIFTNQLDFIWFVEGEEQQRVSIGSWGKGKKPPSRDPSTVDDLKAVFVEFASTATKQIRDAEVLAQHLASIAILIRSAVVVRLNNTSKGALHDQLEFFRKILSLNIDVDSFADIYAQTIAYGLFTARCFHKSKKDFTRELAAYELPQSNPFLRSIYSQLAGPGMDLSLVWAVDHLASILNRTDINKVLDQFSTKSGKKDPVFYFYEDFLSHYDPDLKEARGVYYTPEPVVDYMVRSVDDLLSTTFGLKSGFADRSKIKSADGESVHRVVVLDPAAGTGTFLAAITERIYQTEKKYGRAGNWNAYVREHLIPRLFGLELLMAPYTVCHLKLGLMLERFGFKFKDGERVGVFLTNSLEEPQALLDTSPFLKALQEEGVAAGKVKGAAPVMVVIGNPPYSGHSANSGAFLQKLLRGFDTANGRETESYFHVDGVSIGERQPKWLNDDYVKFIRFSQWKIEQNGCGVLAFITNHNYLSAPTFRAMRAALLHTFDDIYVLDLHGSTKRGDRTEEGSVDQNVFDIQQGVAIALFVKKDSSSSAGKKKGVQYSSLRGPRVSTAHVQGKYPWLEMHSVSTTKWEKLAPSAPYFLFVPRDKKVVQEYEKGISLKTLFKQSGVGIVAGRDHFNFAFTREEIEERILRFMSISDERAREEFELGKDSTAWSIKKAKADIKKNGKVDELIEAVLYRPFDKRSTYYSGDSGGFLARPTAAVNRQMTFGANFAICSARSVEVMSGWSHVLAVDSMVQHHCVSTKEVNHLFPLWTHTKLLGKVTSHHNLSPEGIAIFEDRLGMKFRPGSYGRAQVFGERDIFDYALAVLHSSEYRVRYAEPLRDDFAKVPVTSNRALFKSLATVGARVSDLYLLTEDSSSGSFPINGSNEVTAKRIVVDEDQRIWINDEQYFDGVEEEIRDFAVGGIHVATQWLSDRRGRTLSTDDVDTFLNILGSISQLTDIAAEVDEAIEDDGGWPLS